MNKKKPKSVSKRKVIPRHFTRKKTASLGELLRAASYRQEVKALLRNNKILASALQEAKCEAAANTMMLQNLTRDSNQVLLARNKLKDMASTIQKLVGDLHDVLNYLDVSHLSSTRRTFNNDGVRLRIIEPDLETIEESPRSSVSGDELMDGSPLVSGINPLDQMEMVEKCTPVFDTSATEIYNVNHFLHSNPEMYEDSNPVKEVGSGASSPTIQTPPTPQFDPPSYTSKLTDFVSEKPKEHECKDHDEKPPLKSSASSFLSKIPVRRPNLFPDSCVPDSPEALTPAIRRETYFVNHINNKDNDCAPTFDRRGTFTLQELANELQAKKKADSGRRGTFVIPLLQPPKSDPKPASVFQFPQEICTDDKTVLLSEDMDLTEIIPSGAFQNGSKIQCGNSFFANKNVGSSTVMPSILNASKPISPIEKFNSALMSKVTSKQDTVLSKLKEEGKVVAKCLDEELTPETGCPKPTNKISAASIISNPLNEVSKQSNILVSHKSQDNINTGSIEYIGSYHKSACQVSRQSVLPISPEELLEHQKLSDDQLPDETDLEAINECRKSRRASRKSVLPNPPKELSSQQNLSNDPDETDLDAINKCKKSSSRASRKSVLVLPSQPKEILKQLKLSDKNDLEAINECRETHLRKSVLPSHLSELSKQQSLSNDLQVPDEIYLEAINDCKKSGRVSRKSVLSNHPKETLKQQNLSDKNDLETISESRKLSWASRKSVLPIPPKKSSEQRNLSDDPDVSNENDLKAINECKKSTRASRKSVLPNSSKELLNEQNLSENHDVPDTADKETIDECKNSYSGSPRKSMLPEISESLSSSSFSGFHISDSESVVITPERPRKRIPSRRSLKPNRRGPFIFKNNSKSRKSIPKLNKLDSAGSKGYDFSSSEEEDEVIKKPKSSKKPPKKSSKMIKNKNTVAILERDIGLMYQEQGRRKRSLKQKVSFANINVTPSKSDCENRAENSGEKFKVLDDVFEANEEVKKTNAPVRRSILKKTLLLPCSNDKDSILSESSFSEKDKSEESDSPFEIKSMTLGSNEKSHLASNNQTASSSSKKSNFETCNIKDKADNEKNTESGKTRKQTNGVEGSVMSVLKVVNKPTNIENESSGGLIASSHADDKLKSKSSLKAREENGLPKLSSTKSQKNSDFFGFENKRSKAKRTFSGVSERSSKKRITATDDFLEDVDVLLPIENKKSEASTTAIKEVDMLLTNPAADNFFDKVDFAISGENKEGESLASPLKSRNNDTKDIDKLMTNPTNDGVGIAVISRGSKKNAASGSALKSLNNIQQSTDKLLTNPINDEFLGEVDIVAPSRDKKSEASVPDPKTSVSKNTCNTKSKKSSNAKAKKKSKSKTASEVLTEVKDSLNCRQSNSKKVLKENISDAASSPPPSKAGKTSSTGSLKENTVIPDLEGGGRSRRNRPRICFKEPRLNKKMRRE